MYLLHSVRRPAATILFRRSCAICLRPYSSVGQSFVKTLNTQLPQSPSSSTADQWTPPIVREKLGKGPVLSNEAKDLIKEIPQKIKDASRLMADGNEDESVKILNDVGFDFLNNTPKKERPFALDPQQTASALWTVIQSEKLEDPLKSAVDFSRMLVQLHLARMDDIWMRVLILEQVRLDPDPTAALEIYKNLVELFPYEKLFPETMFIILKSYMMNGKTDEFENALNVIPKEQPRKAMYGAVMLSEGRALEYLDKLKCDDENLSIDQVKYICTIAYAVKEPSILEPLVQLYKLLPDHHPTRLLCYNTLALMYLKKSDSEAIEVLWQSLKKQIPPGDRVKYRHVFQRCRHFYRANNLKVPTGLAVILEKCQIEKM